MNYLPLRVWFIASLTIALSAVIIRLVWEAIVAAPSLAVITLVIFAMLSIYALFLYLAIKPEKLKSLPVRIWASVMVTAAIISAIIHYTRFLPSATTPLSVIIATMLLVAGISAYLLVIWGIWFVGTKKGDQTR